MDPGLEVGQRRPGADDRLEIAKADGTATNADIKQPAGTCEQLRQAFETASSCPSIAVARAGYGEIDGEDEGSRTGGLGPLDEVGNEPAVLDEIKLKPGSLSARRNFGERTGADR